MGTPVPAVDRTMSILAFLRDSFDQPRSLSEIARGTDIHKATCAAVLARLVEHRWVLREPDKSYVLGPQLLSIANAYQRRHPGFALARQEIFNLAERTDLGTSICVAENDELVVLDIAGSVQPAYLPSRVGLHFAFAPPLGNVFKAWSAPDEIHAWFSTMADDYGLDLDAQIAAVSRIRARGYALGSEHDFDIALAAVVRRLERENGDPTRISPAAILAERIRAYRGDDAHATDAEQSVNIIIAPVFDHHGTVVMSIQLLGAPGQIPMSKVDALAARVVSSARRITASIGGAAPGSAGVP